MSDANAPNVFTGAELDRAGDGRRSDGAWVESQWTDSRARALVLGDAGVRAKEGRLTLVPLADAPEVRGAVLLGDDGDGPLWAVDADPPAEGKRPRIVGAAGPRDISPDDGPEGWIGMREAGAVLPAAEGGLAAYAAALLNWRRSHRFCANCGEIPDATEGGTALLCPRCRTTHHPHLEPVVIMIVVGPEGALLGRRGNWPERRYSALAGFVSPGESLEEAVAREVEEESGVAIGSPRYISSQPWPFPASLMLGFLAPWESGEIGGSDPELEDVRWFSRDEVAEACRYEDDWTSDAPGAGLQLPPRTAIARRLAEHWLRETA